MTLLGVSYAGLGALFAGLMAAPLTGITMALMNIVVVPFGWWIYGRLFRTSHLTAVVDEESV